MPAWCSTPRTLPAPRTLLCGAHADRTACLHQAECLAYGAEQAPRVHCDVPHYNKGSFVVIVELYVNDIYMLGFFAYDFYAELMITSMD